MTGADMTGAASRARLTQGREKLLAAAKALLWEQGFEAMSPRDIMARSGAGQGSLYHHFDGKQGLARAALDEMVAEECVAIDGIFAPAKPPAQRIADYLTRQRAALRGCRIGRLANEAAMTDPVLRAPVAAYLDHVEAALRKAIVDGQADGTLAGGTDAEAVAATFLAIIEGGYVLARAHWDVARMERALRGGEALLASLRRAPAVAAEVAVPVVTKPPAAPQGSESKTATIEFPDGGFY